MSFPPVGGRDLDDRGAQIRSRPAEGSDSAAGVSDLYRYLQVLRKRWRLVGGVAAIVVAAVAVGTFLQTPIYRASGLMELRGQSGEGASVEALFQAQRLSNQFLETQYGVLRSPALARRAMTTVGLLELPASGGADSAVAVAGVASDSARLDADVRVKQQVDAFTRRLVVDPVGGSNLVWVHFEHPDPRLAARVVNAVFESYTLMRAEAARAAVTRLATEVETVRGRLTLAEGRLQDYARRNGLTVAAPGRGAPDAEDLPHARLRLLQQQLAEAEADRYLKESLYNLVQSQGEGLLESEILQALNVRLATLRSEYARLRSTFLEDYPKTREVKGQIDEVEALLAREQGRLRGAITSRYLAAVRRQELLQRAGDQQRALVDGQGERATQYRIQARDVEAQQELYAKLQERLRVSEVAAAVASTDMAVVEPAIAPTAPIRPIVASNLKLALVVGLVLGVGLAFLREHVDVTVRTADDLTAFEVPLLGLIPSAPRPIERGMRAWAHQLGGRLALARAADTEAGLAMRRAALKDAFLSLRTAVLLANSEQNTARALLVTSARPGEGKTTIAVNLALSLARMGGRVLLVDADMRRPAAHRAFSIPLGPGLSEALRGEEPWTSLVHGEVTPGLDLLLAGARRDAPTELLASDRSPALLEEARGIYDFVVVDSPALAINAADTRILSSLVDGVVMVVRSGITPRALVGSLLRQAPNVVGVVLNDVDPRHFPAYYYAYGEEMEHAAST